MNNRKTEIVNLENSISDGKSLNDLRKTLAVNNATTTDDSRKTEVVINSNERKTAVSSFPNRATICIGEDCSTVNVDELLGKQIDGEFIFDRVLSINSGQSVVYIVKRLKDNVEFVCKLYRDDATVIDYSVVEALANKINSPYVIKVIKFGYYHKRFYTITPLYKEGSVIEHIEEIDTVLLKKKYIEQLNEGLKAIHDAGIFHCDIKPHNIYFAEDRNKLVYGDFGIALFAEKFNTIKIRGGEAIAKRDLQKNNATIAYLALEGDEYATKAVDYFALGMTILNMAYKGDVYSDVPDKAVRDKIVLEGVRIPDNVDKEIAALVFKMTDADSKRRIGYEGVKKWCNNNSCYGNYSRTSNSFCPVNITNAIFKGNVYNSTEDYTNAMLSDLEGALEHYLRGCILTDLSNSGANADLISEISLIKNKYDSNPMYGLSLTLMTLNPNLSFIIGENYFGDFKGYISYLDSALLKNEVPIFDGAFVAKEIENEFKTHRLKSESSIMTIINDIFASNFDLNYKIEMLRNFFTSQKTLILDKKEFSSIGSLSNILFVDNITPAEQIHIFNDLFFNYLITSNEDMKTNRVLLQDIYNEQDVFERNARLSILLSNVIPTAIDKHPIKCFADIVKYAKELYENNNNSKNLCALLRDGTILKYVKQFQDAKHEEIDLLARFVNSKKNDYDLLADFYNKTQEFAILIVDNIKIDSLEDLYDKLAKTNDIERISEMLVGSTRFLLWLDKMGYKDSIDSLEEYQKYER